MGNPSPQTDNLTDAPWWWNSAFLSKLSFPLNLTAPSLGPTAYEVFAARDYFWSSSRWRDFRNVPPKKNFSINIYYRHKGYACIPNGVGMIGFLQTGYMSLAAAHRNARDRGVGWWCFELPTSSQEWKWVKKTRDGGGNDSGDVFPNMGDPNILSNHEALINCKLKGQFLNRIKTPNILGTVVTPAITFLDKMHRSILHVRVPKYDSSGPK